MKEGELQPGDNVDGWIVKEDIGGPQHRCVYAVCPTGQPDKLYAMKIREPQHTRYFMKEVEALKRINKDGGHPSFQKLLTYSSDPAKMYMIFDPLMPPERNFFKLPDRELVTIDIHKFLIQFFEAAAWGAQKGIRIGCINQEHLFVTSKGEPFFLGLSDEAPSSRPIGIVDIDIFLIAQIAQHIVDAAIRIESERITGSTKDPVFRFQVKSAP